MTEYWNASAGDHWAANHERYDELLGGYGRAAISALDVEADEHVLDVGCGAGGMTLDIARLLAPRGTVVGIDLSHQMIDVARERAGAEGLTNVEFVEGDVTTHPFEAASFHAFTSRFGVMFFDDPARGVPARLAGLLLPGGRAAFVCWQADNVERLADDPDGRDHAARRAAAARATRTRRAPSRSPTPIGCGRSSRGPASRT